MRIVSLLMVLVGCGFPRPARVNADAARSDSSGVDSVVDAYSFGPHRHYVISSIHLPASNTDARAVGLDLNDDGTTDNQLGMAIVAMVGQGIDSQGPLNSAIDRGAAIDLLDVQAPDLANAAAAHFASFIGADPSPPACSGTNDMVCRHHLDGSASFSLAHATTDTPLVGPIMNQTYAGSGGQLTLSLSLLGSAPFEVTLLGARTKLTNPQATMLAGVIGGGVTASDVDSKLIPAMQIAFSMLVQRDCTQLTSPPGCGCATSSTGQSLISIFDSSHDCAITVTEIRNNNLITSLFAPDVMVEGVAALSLGFSFTAVGATFTVPGQ
ncbi:MAG TPA: hypothetical protein VLT45_17600 [Kofleriaceae bacterium]|nr:hypothetical protein [Kofleriaceae bacterium]